MQKSITGILFFILFLFTTGCTTGGREEADEGTSEGTLTQQSNEIIVYGSRTCPHCMVFINKLDDNGIDYTFKEVDKSDENFKEMYEKVQSIKYEGYIQYPIVDINGEILVSPEYDKFRKHLK